MSSYILLQNATAVPSPAPTSFPNAVQPWGATNPNVPPQEQAFQVSVIGTAGNVSASVQIVVSNDGVNWVLYGAAIAAASGYLNSQGSAGGTQPWKYFSAYLTAISGTGASVTVTMSA